MGVVSLLSATRVALRRHPTLTASRSGTTAGVTSGSEPVQNGGAIKTRARPRERSVKLPDEATLTPYRDGPYLLRGAFTLRDQDGAEIANARRVVALCRCGKSRTRPFCDGTHKLIDFRAPGGPERDVELDAADT